MGTNAIIPVEWQSLSIPGQDLIPQAALSLPISHFEGRHGLTFTTDYDDLDWFEAAAFRFGEYLFVIRRYRGYPSGICAICVAADPTNTPIVANEIRALLAQFGVSTSDIVQIREADT